MISRLFAVGLVAAFAALAGCSQGDPAGEAETVESGDSALAQQRPRLLGTIAPGDVKTGNYYAPPQPGAWAFHAKAGDTVTIDVSSTSGGDAVAYLTDDHYNVIAYNDDFRNASHNAQIVYTLPDTIQCTSFRIVFADYDAIPAHFDVALSVVTSEGAVCTYGSNVYHVGDHWPARDGCNTCTCGVGGIDCSKQVCSCNPDGEPDKIYMYTPEQCLTVHITCTAGHVPFQNECGCGCRKL